MVSRHNHTEWGMILWQNHTVWVLVLWYDPTVWVSILWPKHTVEGLVFKQTHTVWGFVSRHGLLYYPNGEAKNFDFLPRHWGSIEGQVQPLPASHNYWRYGQEFSVFKLYYNIGQLKNVFIVRLLDNMHALSLLYYPNGEAKNLFCLAIGVV